MKITLEDLEKQKDPKWQEEEAKRAKEQAERDRTWEDNKSIRQKIGEEKRKFLALDRKEKLTYFRSYYLVPLLVVIAALVFIGTMIRDVIRGQGEILISGMFLNTSLTDEADAYLEQGFVEYLGRTGEKVHVNTAQYVLDFSGGMALSSPYQAQMAVVTQLAAGTLDFVLVDESAFEYLGSHGMIADPEKVLTPETLQKYRDRLVYREVYSTAGMEDEEAGDEAAQENGGQEPAAADAEASSESATGSEAMSEGPAGRLVTISAFAVTDTTLAEKYLAWPEPDKTYLMLVSKEENAERVGRFLDYIFEG